MPPRRTIPAVFKTSKERMLNVNVNTRDGETWMIYFDRGDEMTDDEFPDNHYSETSDGIQFLYYTKVQYGELLKDGTVILPVAMPPPSDDKMAVLPGQKDPISYEPIIDDMKMATFNDEYNKHRYYQYETVESLIKNGSRSVTGEGINPATVKSYTAKIEGRTRVKFEGNPYDLVVISPGKYHLEDDSGKTVREYDNDTLKDEDLEHVGGGRRKTRRSKKRRATRRAKKRTRRSRS